MAHMIENYIGIVNAEHRKPWWDGMAIDGTCQYVNRPMLAEEVLAGLGADKWTIEKVPAKHNDIIIPNQHHVIRREEGKADKILSRKTVADGYKVFQPVESMNILDSLAGPGNLLQYNTAGTLDNGRRIFMTALIESLTFEVLRDDPVQLYLVIYDGWDGSTCLSYLRSGVRVVCQNTMNQALGSNTGHVKIRHTKNAQVNLDEARKALDISVKHSEEFREAMDYLARKKVGEAAFADFLEEYIPVPEEKAEGNNRSHTMAVNQHAKLWDAYDNPIGGDIPGFMGTGWHAYNAVTQHFSHAATSKKTKNGDTEASRRQSSLWFGTAASKTKRALDLLLAA